MHAMQIIELGSHNVRAENASLPHSGTTETTQVSGNPPFARQLIVSLRRLADGATAL